MEKSFGLEFASDSLMRWKPSEAVLVGRVAQPVLPPQLFTDLFVGFGYGVSPADLEETSTGLGREMLQRLPCLGKRNSRRHPAPGWTTAWIATRIPAGVASGTVVDAVLGTGLACVEVPFGRLVAFEVDGVDHGVAPRGSFGCRFQGLLASLVDATGEDNQCLPDPLFAHDLFGGGNRESYGAVLTLRPSVDVASRGPVTEALLRPPRT
jgi:hypothetical protein